jgi:hypothetical protein
MCNGVDTAIIRPSGRIFVEETYLGTCEMRWRVLLERFRKKLTGQVLKKTKTKENRGDITSVSECTLSTKIHHR